VTTRSISSTASSGVIIVNTSPPSLVSGTTMAMSSAAPSAMA
jgi:hypothetical protein